MNKKTRGLVLSEKPINESDKLLTILTDQGKIKAVAKGVKKPKSKMSGACRLFSWSNFVYFPGRNLKTIVEASIIEPYYELSQDYFKLVYASYILELVDKVTLDENEDDHTILKLLVYYLYYLSNNVNETVILSLAFEIKLMIWLGIIPNFLEFDHSDKVYFSVIDGILSDQYDSSVKRQYRLNNNEIQLLSSMIREPFNQVCKREYSKRERLLADKLFKIFNQFLQENLSIFLQSYKVLKQFNTINLEEINE